MTRRVDPRELRKLNAALGMGGVGSYMGRLAIAAVVVILTLAALGATTIPVGPPTAAHGVISTLGFYEGETGSRPYANVRLSDGEVRVRLFQANVCRVGDHVLVYSSRTLLGRRHRLAPAACVRQGG